MDSGFDLARPHQHGTARPITRVVAAMDSCLDLGSLISIAQPGKWVSHKIIDPARGEPEGCFKPQPHMYPYGSSGWDFTTISAMRSGSGQTVGMCCVTTAFRWLTMTFFLSHAISSGNPHLLTHCRVCCTVPTTAPIWIHMRLGFKATFGFASVVNGGVDDLVWD